MLKTVGFPSTRTGDQTIVNGNLVIGTAGKGIDFSVNPNAPGATSELLDDYEAGTFTPTIVGTISAGTATYSQQHGKYTKIGRLVFIELYLVWSGGTGTGSLRVGGLPFAAGAGSTYPAMTVAEPNNIALTAGNYLSAYGLPSSTELSLSQTPTGGGLGGAVPYDGAGTIQIAGCYSV